MHEISLSNLNIAFVAGTLGQGGAERQLYYNLRGLKGEGAKVTLYCLTKGEFWESKIRALNIPVIWFGQNGLPPIRLLRLIRLLEKSRPEVLQSQHFYTNPYVAVAGRLLHIPQIGAMRNDGESEVKANGKILGKLCLHLPAHIAANTKCAIQFAEKQNIRSNRLIHFPNVIDLTNFRNTNPAAKTDRSEKQHIIFVGRLERQKRADRFLRILAEVKETIPNVTASIIGNGAELESLQAMAISLKLQKETLEFLGEAEDMSAIYSKAHLLVLTSDWEGSPNVLLEAMAARVPVVASKVGGVPDMIEHNKTGYLLEPENESGFTQAIVELLSNPEKATALTEAAEKYVERTHSVEALLQKLEKLYRSVLYR